jgi:hypothetical protein
MKIVVGVAVLLLSAGSAYAGTVAPEIDGAAGLAAMGAVGAVVAFVWERRRRRTD